ELALAKAEVRRVRAELRRPGVERAGLMASALTSVAAMRDKEDPELDEVVRDLLRDFGGPSTPLGGRSRAASLAPSGRLAAFGTDGVGASIVNPFRPTEGTVVSGHDATVSAVVWGPNGDLVAVADDGGHVTVWSARRAEVVSNLKHPTAVRGAAFDPRGKLLVSTGDDGSVRLWDVESAKEIASLVGHNRPVYEATFRPTGEPLLATAGDDGNVCLWSGPSLSTELCFEAHNSWVHALTFSRTGDRLASAGDDGVIRVITGMASPSLDGLSEAMSIAGHEGPVTSVVWGPAGRTLLSGSFDRSVRLWDLSGKPKETIRFSGHQDWVWKVRGVWSGGLRYVVTASADGLVRLFDPRGKLLREFAGDGTAVRTLDVDSDGRWLSWGGETSGRLIDLESSVGNLLPRSLDGLINVGCRWLSAERASRAEVEALWQEEGSPAPCGA
ncbi:MAG: WD40 repeat domain-containing protein, partial [Deltaproteobacteria bacterium]|nr:WD40 repeat domain-containing protein [Deltaproteobacteria bacterium]